MVGAVARTAIAMAITLRPAQPAPLRRSQTMATARTAVMAGSLRPSFLLRIVSAPTVCGALKLEEHKMWGRSTLFAEFEYSIHQIHQIHQIHGF
ncbi:MAG TPA: hypothetical protein DEB66_10370 [Micrococcaceae bacterium]|nr:hypothetical protein [Micrococcaceae bacterium]